MRALQYPLGAGFETTNSLRADGLQSNVTTSRWKEVLKPTRRDFGLARCRIQVLRPRVERPGRRLRMSLHSPLVSKMARLRAFCRSRLKFNSQCLIARKGRGSLQPESAPKICCPCLFIEKAEMVTGQGSLLCTRLSLFLHQLRRL